MIGLEFGAFATILATLEGIGDPKVRETILEIGKVLFQRRKTGVEPKIYLSAFSSTPCDNSWFFLDGAVNRMIVASRCILFTLRTLL